MPLRLAPVLFLLLAAAVLPAGTAVRPAAAAGDASDWSLDLRFEGDGETRRAELRLHGDRISLREEGADEEVLLSPEEIVVLDHGDRTYMRFTFAQIEATLGAVYGSAREAKRARVRELSAVLDSLSAPERALVEQEIARLTAETGPDPDRLHLTPGTETATIAGLEAGRVTVTSGESPLAEAWITQRIPVVPFKRLLSRLAPLLPPEEASLNELLALLQRLEGFPLKVTPAGRDTETFLVLGAETKRFKDKEFEPPADYARSTSLLGR
jgi:hypothetical protein